jgi:hypothetical protein
MRCWLLGMIAGLLTFLICLTISMLNLSSGFKPPENSASQTAAEGGGIEFRIDFAEVFRGFDFVGSSVFREEGDACPYGLDESWPIPAVIETHRMYIFHYRDNAGKSSPFYVLQERLRSLGIEADLSDITFHGMRPHPHILYFQGKGYVGNITGGAHCTLSTCGKESPSWEVSDYVLTLMKEP